MGMCKECGGVFAAAEMENGVCESCRNSSNQETKKEGSTMGIKVNSAKPLTKTSLDTNQEVVITDIKMPFFSMVIFMVKWVIASIPAFIILFILASILLGFIGGLGNIVVPQGRY